MTLIQKAIFKNNEAAVFSLLDLGADVCAGTYHGTPPLHEILKSTPSTNLLSLCLDRGLQSFINAKDDAGNTPLLTAARYGVDPQLLLETGANPQARNHAGESALYLALRFQGLESGQDLLDQSLTTIREISASEIDGSSELHHALSAEISKAIHLQMDPRPAILSWLALGVDINATNEHGHTVLHSIATESSHNHTMCGRSCRSRSTWSEWRWKARALEVLLNAGANPTALDLDGDTPLHLWSWARCPISKSLYWRIPALLFSFGARWTKNTNGDTPGNFSPSPSTAAQVPLTIPPPDVLTPWKVNRSTEGVKRRKGLSAWRTAFESNLHKTMN